MGRDPRLPRAARRARSDRGHPPSRRIQGPGRQGVEDGQDARDPPAVLPLDEAPIHARRVLRRRVPVRTQHGPRGIRAQPPGAKHPDLREATRRGLAGLPGTPRGARDPVGAVFQVRREQARPAAEPEDRLEARVRHQHPPGRGREGDPRARRARPEAREGPRAALRSGDREDLRTSGRSHPARPADEVAPRTPPARLRREYAPLLLRPEGSRGVERRAPTRPRRGAHRRGGPHRTPPRRPVLVPERPPDVASEGGRIRGPRRRHLHGRRPAALRPRANRLSDGASRGSSYFAPALDAPRGRTTRVLAVGGTGRIGRVSSKLLARREIVSEICIAGRDLGLAQRTAGEIGSKASALELDATDEEHLASAVRGYDLIVSTAGPDFRVALPVAQAAVAAGVHVCDVAVDPFENRHEVRLPGGAAVTAIPIGSTEPLTLPRRNRGLKSVSVLMAILPRQLSDLLRERAREIAGGRSDPAKATMALLDAIAADPDRWLKGPVRAPSDFGMMASANGIKDRRKVRTSCWPAGPWESTVGPLTVAALRILHGKVRDRGVLPPEAAFEPLRFLAEAARAGPGRPGPGRLLNESREPLK